ncbi:dnaJ homolog subfamily C member 10-like [Maniola hyperantus]|uniref:dnaJ homolog subfamily C member 10-like n=1 Tax=Aphantopus hyperantus TaxID=2795564 RepID=UPI001567FD9D|nr:dnaJ homolog subfamily C member 10-like [Maniola hyperantus]
MSSALALLQGLGQKVRGREQRVSDCRTLQMNMPQPVNVNIEFKDITMEVSTGFLKKSKKTILRNVSGLFKTGQLTAIMGPSGAGKTSLLNALTGFSTEGVKGVIHAGDMVCELGNNRDSQRDYRKKTSYILQDDRLNPLFTVAELMQFAADLKLGNTLTPKLKNTVIREVLENLGLTGTESTRCCNLSGGQRKRVSIAVELLDNPPVLFLDEPTTGLDSMTSAQCMEMLKNLARAGRTVICTIHQPTASVYNLFDQVYILANGLNIYNGSSADTVPYLASVGLHCPMYHNPADYVLEIANGEYGNFNELLAAKCSRDYATEKTIALIAEEPKFSCGKMVIVINKPHELYKFSVLLRRCAIQQYRDWTVTHLKVLLHLVIGVLLGLLFERAGSDASKTFSNLGYLIVSTAYLTYTSLMPGVLKFPDELPVLKKENFNNWYNLKTYYAAILLTSIPLQISYSIIYSTPSYVLTGQPIEVSRFAMFVLVLANVTLLADALGNLIGSCVSAVNGTFFGAITTCAMLVFAGFLVLPTHMHPVMQVISYISFLKYAFEALTLSVYAYNRPPLACPDEILYCHLRIKLLLIALLYVILISTVNLSSATYYQILGVSKSSSTQEIRQAYKKLAVKLHPDKNPNGAEQKRFLEITEAYETLKDPEKRHKYDLYGSQQSYTRKYDYHSQTEYNNLYYNGLYHDDPFVETLSGGSFYAFLSEGLHFVNFYSPFCPPCQNLADAWKKLAETYQGIIKVGAVNCKYYNSFCYNNMRIGSYPTLLFYPNGKKGNYIYYNGAHTMEALEDFVMKFVRSRVHVPTVTQVLKNTDKPVLYIVDEDSFNDISLTRLAYHLKHLATVVKASNVRDGLTNDPETTIVFKHRTTQRELRSVDEKTILKEIVDLLPKVEKISFEKLKKIRNNLRTGEETPWVLFFSKKDVDNLLFYQMVMAIPEMNFGEIDCEEDEELCASLQVEEAPTWAVLKVGGAYQRLFAAPTKHLLRQAAQARALHTLSESELQKILDGEMSSWVLLVAPYQVSWDHLLDPFTELCLELADTDISFGIMSCSLTTDEYCRLVARNQPVVLLQDGTNRHTYNGHASKDEMLEFVQLIRESSELEITEEQALEIMDVTHREHVWLVAYLPGRCGRVCDELRHEFRLIAKRLRPLESMRVGVLSCPKQGGGFCSNIRAPTARLYLVGSKQFYTTNLEQISQAPYIMEWALGFIDDTVRLNWQTFTSTVIAEELHPSRNKKPWLVYFHSPRCYHCYERYPDFAILAISLRKTMNFGKVNCLTDRSLCQHEHITSYPSLRLYLSRNRHSTSRVVALQPKEYTSLLQDIRPHLMKYDDHLLESIKNIEIKSHVHFRDEL